MSMLERHSYHLHRADPNKLRPVNDIREYWEPQAEDWFHHWWLESCFVDLARDGLQQYALQVSENGPILDIAAGSNNSVYYPDGFDISRVWAMDLSQSALRLNTSGHTVHADAREPFQLPGSFYELTVSIYGMRYFENQEAVILEMLRVTQPGSWIVLIDFLSAINGDAVRRFNVNQLTQFVSENTDVATTQTERLHKGHPGESPIDLLAIQKTGC